MDSVKRPTIADVAQEAGVSTVTVSRVLAGSDQVSEATTRKVRRAIDALGYYGNSVARQLVSGRPETLGIVTTDTITYGYAQTISGVERQARDAGMSSLICVLDLGDHERADDAVRSMLGHPLAGVVIIDFDADAHRVIGMLPTYMPVVAIGEPHTVSSSERPYVAFDEYEGARALVNRLIELGHTSVFIIAQPNNDPPERRSVGALDALRDACLPTYPVSRCQEWSPEEGRRLCTHILERYGEAVTAVVCPNDEIAVGAMRAVADAGLRVPEDVSVTGFDGVPIGAQLSPSLTTVRQDFVLAGRQAVDLLLGHHDAADGGPPHAEIHPEVIERESIAPPNPARGLRRASADLRS
nr:MULTISPECIES: LacI family DNA-binding transcriptional regulator [unclassified Actinomyces]